MPELPEVEAVRLSVEPLVLGRTVSDVIQSWHRTTLPLSPKLFCERLLGQSIVSSTRIGKYLMLHTQSGGTLLVHLRMTGQLLGILTKDEALRHERLRVVFKDGSALAFVDQRKFGRVQILNADEFKKSPSLLGLGPDALNGKLSAKVIQQQLSKRKISIKAALLDQSLMAGLGNIYVDEALFRSGIHPLRLANSLTLPEVTRLFKEVRAVLKESIRYQGTTFRDYRTAKGEKGGFFERLFVYGQTGKLCRRCKKSTIQKIRVAQRGTHVCERCQKRLDDL